MKTAGVTLVSLGVMCFLGIIAGISDSTMTADEAVGGFFSSILLLGIGAVLLRQAKKHATLEEVASDEPTSDELAEEILREYPDPKNKDEVRTAFFALVKRSAKEALHKYPDPKNENEIRTAFFTLVEKYNGHITLFKFAMETNLPGEVARDFLDRQAKVFNASFDVTDRGDVVYRFPV